MRGFRSWRNLARKRQTHNGWALCQPKQKPFMVVVCTIMLYIACRTTYQHLHKKVWNRNSDGLSALIKSQLADHHPTLFCPNLFPLAFTGLKGLPYGIIQAKSDLELKPLWSASSSKLKAKVPSSHNLLAMPVGLKQKDNVNTIVRKFLKENFTIILFHYDGKMDGWWDLKWCNKAIHIVAENQTKWWFAKRFLHPAAVSIYDYVFLWDEDLGVQHFNPRRYLDVVKAEGLEISQPALDPNSTDIHHRITVRKRKKKFHRRLYDPKGSVKCSSTSLGPPCNGFVEGMAPVFSKAAWHCAWHLIQNDLVHGWGMDMKLGYCAQGLKNVGIVDSQFVLHQGIPTLGGPAPKKVPPSSLVSFNLRVFGLCCGFMEEKVKRGRNGGGGGLMVVMKMIALCCAHVSICSIFSQTHRAHDMRTEIRRQSTAELEIFKQRWEKAVEEDTNWVDPLLNVKKDELPQVPTREFWWQCSSDFR
ncbi:hypothetical protein OSB04_001996 [Centaurea solstitialis]|uniref:Uncharacterized protein n=1 Tax=Centaurea solstitialis TaxID=347529 RepID=A0AA38WSZ1_9ASTR|nr:hypothetical protein OSB04_001996 [Centaurea solstitialis]